MNLGQRLYIYLPPSILRHVEFTKRLISRSLIAVLRGTRGNISSATSYISRSALILRSIFIF